MAEVNLCSWPEISQASKDLQLNSIAATLEHILARFARLETRLVEHERRVAATLPPLQPEPDPPDGTPMYAVAHTPYQQEIYPPLEPYYQQSQPTYGYPPAPPQQLQPVRTQLPTSWDPPQAWQPSAWEQPAPYPGQLDRQKAYQPNSQPSRLPYSGTNLHIQQRISEVGDHPWQPEYQPPRPLPFSNHSLPPPLPPTPPRSPSSWWSPSHCRSAATLLAIAPPPSSLPDDNTSTMVLGEDASDDIVPKNATHNVGATLDVPNDKFLEEIVNNDEESPQVLVEATAEKNMVYDDKTLPQVLILMPLLNRGVGSAPIQTEVMEILFQDGVIMFRWISGWEYIHSSRQTGRRGIGEGKRLIVRCAFDPGGESSPKLLFASLFVVSWFPP